MIPHRPLPVIAMLVALAACRSNPFGTVERGNAREHLDSAEADIAAGNPARALKRLESLHEVTNLDPDLRVREERLTDEAARARFAELAAADPDDFEELFESKLPVRVRARAGVLAAQRMLELDERIHAFRMIKRVDEALPGHPERVLAGDVLARAGLSLVHDERRYNLLFHYRPRGVQALEYLVVHYPLEPRCPEAYFALSEVYESQGDIDEAIDRTKDLLLYHPDSPYAVGASARLPYLRLLRLKRDDYDRAELLRAREELAAWQERNPEHELTGWVRELARGCDLRIVESDLYLARYYRTVQTPFAVRLHAGRAREIALARGFEEQASEAQRLLESASEPAIPAGAAR